MNPCNAHNRNVHIVNSIRHHIKPLNAGKFDCSFNVSKLATCKSSNKSVRKINDCPVVNPVREYVIVNQTKRACKRR